VCFTVEAEASLALCRSYLDRAHSARRVFCICCLTARHACHHAQKAEVCASCTCVRDEEQAHGVPRLAQRDRTRTCASFGTTGAGQLNMIRCEAPLTGPIRAHRHGYAETNTLRQITCVLRSSGRQTPRSAMTDGLTNKHHMACHEAITALDYATTWQACSHWNSSFH
jgi:hypothetical protein